MKSNIIFRSINIMSQSINPFELSNKISYNQKLLDNLWTDTYNNRATDHNNESTHKYTNHDIYRANIKFPRIHPQHSYNFFTSNDSDEISIERAVKIYNSMIDKYRSIID